MIPIAKRRELRNQWSPYSPNWNYHNALLAKAVRQWRETNTLTLVK